MKMYIKTALPGDASDRGSSTSDGKLGLPSLSGPLNGVAMAPIFASLVAGSSLEFKRN